MSDKIFDRYKVIDMDTHISVQPDYSKCLCRGGYHGV